MKSFKVRVVARGSRIQYSTCGKWTGPESIKEETINDDAAFKVPTTNLVYCTPSVWTVFKKELSNAGHKYEMVN